MVKFDTQTLFLLLAVGNVFIILFFITYIHFYHTRIRKLNKYVIARILQTIAWTIYLFHINGLDASTMAVSTIPIAFGIALEIYCLLTATDGFVKKKFVTLLLIALTYTFTYFIFSSDMYIRVILASVFYSLSFGYIWIDFSLRSPRLKIQKTAGWLGFIIVLLFLNRGVHVIMLKMEMAVNSQLYFNVMAGIGLFIIMFSWPLIFLLLHKEQDELVILEKDKLILRNNKELKKMNAAKDRFFRIISHDLRTPMSSIISFLDLIESELKEKNYEQMEYYYSIVAESAKESFSLLDNLLHWSIFQSKDKKVVFTQINVQEIANHIITLFQIKLREKEIKIETQIQQNIQVKADQFLLETTLRNLISNAIKFTNPNGKIIVRATLTKLNVVIEVEDNGIGISPENIRKLFYIESNFGSEGTQKEKGTGLGLVLCKEFTSLQRGKIEVESEPQKGSVFRILLPVR